MSNPGQAGSDKPDAITLRSAFSRFATGITVLTITDQAGTHHGVTVNSFSSVSLDPALVLWSLGDATYGLGAFLEADHYAVNVLSKNQQHVSDNFAMPGNFNRFETISYTLSNEGLALLDGCIARFLCRKYKIDRVGDHWLFVGRVYQTEEQRGEPLIYYKSAYRSLVNE